MKFNIPVRNKDLEQILIALGGMLMAQLDDLRAGQAAVDEKIAALSAKVDAFLANLPTAVDLTEAIAAESAQGTAVDAVATKIPG